MRLFWKFFLCLFASAALAMTLAGAHANSSLRRIHREQVASELRSVAEWAANEIQEHVGGGDFEKADERCKDFGALADMRVTVVTPDGRVAGDSDSDPGKMENHGNRPEIAEALAGKIGRAERFSGTLRRNLAYVAVPVWTDGAVVAAVRTAMPLAEIERTLTLAHREVVLGAAAAAILFAVLSSYFVKRFVRPMEEMRCVAERLAAGDLSARVENPPAEEELISLAQALNRMAEQLGARMETITGQRNELEAVLSSMSEGVLAVDSAGKVIHYNAAAAEMMGLDKDAAGCPLAECVRHPMLQRFVRGLLATGKGFEEDALLEWDRHVQLHGAPLEDAAGRRIGALAVLSDTTRLKRLEKMRQDFVANVSHELKTPITALRGCVETLLDSERSDEDRRFIAMMGRQVERLGAIVGDLLSLSRLEHDEQNGRVPLEPGPIREVLRRAAGALAKAAEAKRIAVEVRCPEGLVAPINAALLEQAVGNLIDNAMKYSGEGARVEVEAGEVGAGLFIRVKDDGPGIEQRHLGRIFERFYRVDQARSRALGGTGLGLAIVKHIAQAHGGAVGVESTPGKGSAFIIRLPKRMVGGE